MKFLSLKPIDDTRLVRRQSLGGVRCQLVAKTASTLCAVVLKPRDTVLAKVKDYILRFFYGPSQR